MNSKNISDECMDMHLNIRIDLKWKQRKPSRFVLKIWFDLILFADIFEKFRNSNLRNYGLFLIHYSSTPALSWDAMFNMAKVELELITGADRYLFFEKGMKGGVSCIYKRYNKASNRYLKSYEPKQESKNIIYLRKACAPFWELAVLFKTKIKTKKVHRVLVFNQVPWL